jgi:hypothetical protein
MSADGGDLIPRAVGDDVIVPVRFRRASFDRLTSTADGRSVPVSAGAIGLVPDERREDDEQTVWTFVVWSGKPTWSAAGELIPGNAASVEAALAAERDGTYWEDDE